MKNVRIQSYSGPYFPAFGLNTERYGVYLRIQSKCGKMRTRLTPNTHSFYTVWHLTFSPYARDTYTKEIYWGKRWISIVPPNYLRYWCSFYKPKSKIWMISVEIENNITYFLAKVTLTYQIFKFVTWGKPKAMKNTLKT